MKATTKSSTVKVTVVLGALSALLAFGGALAYLTDHDTRVNEVAFLQVDGGDETGEGLITLSEAQWDGDTTGTGQVHGMRYALNGILPGDTLTKDPTITVNDWLQSTTRDTPDLNLFMKVMVPKADVTGDGTPELLFAHTPNSGWTLMGTTAETITDDTPGRPAGTYDVFHYYFGANETLTRANTDTEVPALFTSVTYTADATGTPDANQHIVVDAYAIQADSLSATTPAAIYKLASGEDVA